MLEPEELSITQSKRMMAGGDQLSGDFVAEWERKLKHKQRSKRPSRPPIEDIFLTRASSNDDE